MGGSVAVWPIVEAETTTGQVVDILKMVELFEERYCELLRSFEVLYDVSLPEREQLLQNSWEAIGRELNVS